VSGAEGLSVTGSLVGYNTRPVRMERKSPPLPQRHDAHVGEDASIQAVLSLFSDPLFLVRSEGSHDYGVDLEIEALLDGGASVSNFRAQAQLKSSWSEPNADGSHSCNLELTNVNYVLNGSDGLYLFYSRRSQDVYFEWASDVWARATPERTSSVRRVAVRFKRKVDTAALREIWQRLVDHGNRARQQRVGGAVEPPARRPGTHVSSVWKLVEHASRSMVQHIARQRLDFRFENWPVRDQGQRETSVACALGACVEFIVHETGSRDNEIRLSDTFLYWAAKRIDGIDAEGTTLFAAAKALEELGICTDDEVAAIPQPWEGRSERNILETAASRRRTCLVYGSLPGPSAVSSAGAVLFLLSALKRPLALTLPVFSSPSDPALNNWNSYSAEETGLVMDPPADSVAFGGHAVCVTGYEPDPSPSSGGGWFVFRNSWGDGWASNRSRIATLSPAPGYGYVSARYVDLYAWEVCAL
jgi:hypothetical protein